MEIMELNIKHFGKFLEHKVNFQPGVNIIYGGNETGKSTIHAFIRAMFFGIERGRGKAGKKDEYQLRQPWENSTYFEGSMRLCCKGQIFRIERNFYKNEKDVRLICESSGQELPADLEELQQLLGGMNEAAFSNTIFIPQAGSETDAGLAEELRKFMVNFQESGDGSLDVTRALEKLKSQKRNLEAKKKREQELLDEKIARKEMETNYVRQELERSEATDCTAKQDGLGENVYREPEKTVADTGRLSETGEDQKWTEEREETPGFYEKFLLCLNILLFLCGGLGIACGMFAESIGAKIGLTAVGILSFALLWMTARYTVRSGAFLNWLQEVHGEGSHWKNKKSFETEKETDGTARSDQTRDGEKKIAQDKRRWLLEEQRREQREKSRRLELLNQETAQLFHQREQLISYDREIAAVDLAMLRIRELSAKIYQEAGVDFGRTASALLEELTEGNYTQIALDEHMEVRINTPKKLLYLHQVSYGTMNQVYFALRMAAGKLLTGGQPLPIILDEPFAMYDEDRLEAALRWLDNSGRQVILFTCQKREKEILDRIRRGR